MLEEEAWGRIGRDGIGSRLGMWARGSSDRGWDIKGM